MSKIKMLCLFFPLLGSVGFAQERKIKDGKQYTYDLERRLNTQNDEFIRNELMTAFAQNRGNIPKGSNQINLSSGIEAMAKVAVLACTFEAQFNENWTQLSELYELILDRKPTAEEIKSALRNPDGTLDFFSNCLMLALHPEFIFQKEGR